MPQEIPPRVRKIHMVPIGGTLAAPLAGLLKDRGFEVTGSDLELYSPMKELIQEIGITPRVGFSPENVPSDVDLVLIGNAVPRTNPEVVGVLERDLPYTSMPEALKHLVLEDRHPVVITGTHGKTTTTSLVAWLLQSGERDPGFLVGGIPKNFGRSFRLGAGKPFVIEGDEYNTAFFDRDAKFLHYAPRIAVVTHLEFDHGDIFPDLAAIEAQFEKLVALVPPTEAGGRLIVCRDAPKVRELAARLRPDAITYGLSEGCRYRARNLRPGSAGTNFDLEVDGAAAGRVTVALYGRHNVQNALAAIAVGRELGLSLDALGVGLRTFEGARRRLDERGTIRGITVVDDFAHHPTAVRETILGARGRYPDRRIHVLFEPRSLTSARVRFRDDYREAFRGADLVSFAPIHYLERLSPDERIDFPALAEELTTSGLPAIAHPSLDALADETCRDAQDGDVLLFMSSGSFGGVIERVLSGLKAGA